jgi:protein phosphatase
MLRMKLLTVEQAAVHPARSQLTKSLGADPLVQVQLVRQPVRSGDVLVLCCDGLWDAVAGPEMATLVAAGSVGSAGAAARRLVETAVARKAADNVTAVVVRMHSDRPIPPAPSRRSFFRRARS